MLIDTEGIVSAINEIGAKRIGKNVEQILGLCIYDYLPRRVADSRKAQDEEVIRTGKPVSYQDERDGRVFDINHHPVFDAQKGVKRIAIFTKDITANKLAEDELRESEEKFRSLYEGNRDAIGRSDIDGRILETNKTFRELTGYSAQELSKMTHQDFTPKKWHKREAELIQASLDKDHLPIFEKEYRRKDGTIVPIELSGLISRDEKGRPAGIWAFIRDISDRKLAEKTLRGSEERYRTVLQDQTEVISRFRVDGTFTFVNDVYCRFFGKSSKELLGKQWQPVAVSEDLETIEEKLATLSEDNPIVIIENRVYSGSGEIRWMQFVNRGFFDQEGQLIEIQSVGRDINDRKLAEEKLAGYRNNLEEIVKERTAELKDANLKLQGEISERKQTEEALLESETFLHKTGQMAKVGGWEIDGKTKKVFWTKEIYNITEVPVDYDPSSLEKEAIVFFSAEDQLRLENAIQRAFEHNEPYDMIFQITTAKGNKKWVHAICEPIVADGKVVKLSGTFQDISERKRAEEALQDSEQRLNLAIQGTNLGMWDWNVKTGDVIYSEHWARMLGYELDELAPDISTWENLVHPEDKDRVMEILNHHFEDGDFEYNADFRLKAKSGGWRWTNSRGRVFVRDEEKKPVRMVGTHVDITDGKLAEEQIKATLKEKEVLLQEIHHRVKNNMQVISSLLKLQADTVKDKQVIDALINSQMRVQAMAWVHETLYSTESLASIDFKTYASKLVRTIFQTYGIYSGQVELKIESEDITFGIKQATPARLLINELVSNALKHAFPESRSGEIAIKLKKTDEDEIELVVGDNGIGLPEDFDWRNSDTLGFKLVTILAEGQLDGNINLNRDNGTRFVIGFKLENNH